MLNYFTNIFEEINHISRASLEITIIISAIIYALRSRHMMDTYRIISQSCRQTIIFLDRITTSQKEERSKRTVYYRAKMNLIASYGFAIIFGCLGILTGIGIALDVNKISNLQYISGMILMFIFFFLGRLYKVMGDNSVP